MKNDFDCLMDLPLGELRSLQPGIEGRIDVDIITRDLELWIVLDNGRRSRVVKAVVTINPFQQDGEFRGRVEFRVSHPSLTSLAEARAYASALLLSAEWARSYTGFEWAILP